MALLNSDATISRIYLLAVKKANRVMGFCAPKLNIAMLGPCLLPQLFAEHYLVP